MFTERFGIHADDVLGEFAADVDEVEVLLADGVGQFGDGHEGAVPTVERALRQPASDARRMNVETEVEVRRTSGV